MKKKLTLTLFALALAGLALAVRAAEEHGLVETASRPGEHVIARVWHGKTAREKADEYEKYLAGAITKFPTIPGSLGYQLLRLDGGPDGEAFSPSMPSTPTRARTSGERAICRGTRSSSSGWSRRSGTTSCG